MATNVAPTGLAKDLAERADAGKPVRIGLVGSGEMGTDIVTRAAMMDGVEVAAISEINVPNAHKAVEIAHQEAGHSQNVSTTDALNAAIEDGKCAITDNVDALLDSGLIDVVIDATGIPAVGADIGMTAKRTVWASSTALARATSPPLAWS